VFRMFKKIRNYVFECFTAGSLDNLGNVMRRLFSSASRTRQKRSAPHKQESRHVVCVYTPAVSTLRLSIWLGGESKLDVYYNRAVQKVCSMCLHLHYWQSLSETLIRYWLLGFISHQSSGCHYKN
jgi:hypothetical protein